MKYGNGQLTLSRIEAVLDKLGGEEGALRFLRGDTEVVERYKLSLIYLFGTLELNVLRDVNHNINPKHFPLEEIRSQKDDDYKVFGSPSSSWEDVLTQICDEGYVPANLYELLFWGRRGRGYEIIALGSSIPVDNCSFPILYIHRDNTKALDLVCLHGRRTCGLNRFLAIRNPNVSLI